MREETRLFDYTKAELSILADKLNFVRDTLEKVLRLGDILVYLNSNPITKSTLALKGGTAINFNVFNLPRLSVDIDLDFHSNTNREEMLQIREIIRNDITTYMTTQGYALSPKSKSPHSLDSFVFVYKNLGGMNDNIKIEINYSLRSHIFEPKGYSIATTAIVLDTKIFSLHPMEIFAAKINALLSRAAARDLYDVYNMIKFGLFDDGELDLLRKCVVLYNAISQENIWTEFNTKPIEAISFRKIKTDLLPVITKGEVVPLDDMKNIVKNFIEKLMILTDNEKQFIEGFMQKKYLPELLFDDTKIIANIHEHPMIKWKIQNV